MAYMYLYVDRYTGETTRCEQFDFDDLLEEVREMGEDTDPYTVNEEVDGIMSIDGEEFILVRVAV